MEHERGWLHVRVASAALERMWSCGAVCGRFPYGGITLASPVSQPLLPSHPFFAGGTTDAQRPSSQSSRLAVSSLGTSVSLMCKAGDPWFQVIFPSGGHSLLVHGFGPPL